ncbi:hypothetical protein [Synechococcus sp. BIOS-E4-1]|uniref:hypothetical protein n=1 Tax=Synechococcus sp. BIOS-E4-1 TaxID=1400864 RepID=UPI001CA3A124|nr:hypothetical protein [Synechococcus sp. BIOS-E4-1]
MRQRAVSQYLPIDPEARCEALGELADLDITKLTRNELLHLSGILRVLYDDAVDELRHTKEQESTDTYMSTCAVGVAEATAKGITPAAGQMSVEEWSKIHRINPVTGKNKRGFAPKNKKSIFDISEGTHGTISKEQHEERVKEGVLDELTDAERIRAELDASFQQALDNPKVAVRQGKRVRGGNNWISKREDFYDVARK